MMILLMKALSISCRPSWRYGNMTEREFQKINRWSQERRTEMEGLDLAVERQKRLLEKMRQKERSLLMQKKANLRQLEALGLKGERRR
jgi:hypothetical protein